MGYLHCIRTVRRNRIYVREVCTKCSSSSGAAGVAKIRLLLALRCGRVNSPFTFYEPGRTAIITEWTISSHSPPWTEQFHGYLIPGPTLLASIAILQYATSEPLSLSADVVVVVRGKKKSLNRALLEQTFALTTLFGRACQQKYGQCEWRNMTRTLFAAFATRTCLVPL